MMSISQIICGGSDVQNVLTVTSESTEEIIKGDFAQNLAYCFMMSIGVTECPVA